MIRRLKHEKKLTNKALSVLLAPTITHLDLEGVYLTNKTLRMVWTQCPNLKAVSLKDCGYIITDTVLAQFTKNLQSLERLNLCFCSHLTNKCLSILAKNSPRLHTLHMAKGPLLTYKGVLDFILKAPAIKYLDVFYLRVSHEEQNSLMDAAKARDLMLLLRGPRGGHRIDEEGGKVEDDDDDSEECVESLSHTSDEEEEEKDGENESDNGGATDRDAEAGYACSFF
ncbi:DNA replication ATP-dependent helicase/nuclease dna2-like [Plakobranchus ocellatus]|uniref:DNA replication ATP-dependent helicase/nuclease dna2-like n=1 Tax=Plakobranchus ocellatus TaxID=259542 RepID=A0AAV4DQ91_9GAST|nr:DNA replication ATP-dependent helicase/nuclease dna2-like [Plakobranchus ocellatus]